ncbi:hypothetical protein [Chryseobacterium sp. W4I1]|uniref:hypothetical protein n=1 Tax=Chryseobacterium sp. W4I1 TaxID=3042293 RepID=UPI002789E79F|nr:hypothetical protein [Chryseobacterium sp. W4I1]MDQ0784331.1 hypothetical protein [Chryseobacterium sp. W4I1]
MENELSIENSNCDEIKRKLIKQIKNLDCEELLLFEKNEIPLFNTKYFRAPVGDHAISPDSKNGQINALPKTFPLFPSHFIIKKVGDIIDLYRKTKKHMYVYFLYEGINTDIKVNINIAFVFTNDNYKGDDSTIKDNEVLYILEKNSLVIKDKTQHSRFETAVENFKDFFNKSCPDNKFTKYLMFTMELVDKNFKSFDDDTEILVGAMPYAYNIERPNLILKINENRVDITVYEKVEDHNYFFNMGHLYP